MDKLKKFVYIFINGLFVISITYFIVPCFFTQNLNSHNCRFWGIIFSGSASSLESTIRTQLDSLQSLGNSNPDGWGIGYYLSPDTGVILPVIYRGEPSALIDPRYNKVIDDMVDYIEGSAIAHLRSGTSGPISGIPNPHPFRREAIYRDFEMLLAHNGVIPTDVLLELIQIINPTYLDSNPPDYMPNYLDSDLYAIYVMEVIDTYLEYTIEDCIKIAITKLDSALGSKPAQGNFIMSDGSTLWALRYLKNTETGFTLYYYPNETISDFWVAASKPLDTPESWWVVVPNSTLVKLIPGQPPELINVFHRDEIPGVNINGLGLIYPNPFKENTIISYAVSHASQVNMKIYDVSGRLIRQFDQLTNNQLSFNHVVWDGKDNSGNEVSGGAYFCSLIIGDSTYVKKLVLVK